MICITCGRDVTPTEPERIRGRCDQCVVREVLVGQAITDWERAYRADQPTEPLTDDDDDGEPMRLVRVN